MVVVTTKSILNEKISFGFLYTEIVNLSFVKKILNIIYNVLYNFIKLFNKILHIKCVYYTYNMSSFF